MGDFMGLRKNFSPQTSSDRMFFPDIQSYWMAGISLQDFFVLKIRLQDIFFLKSPIPPPPPPPPSKVKWSAPYKLFAHDRQYILACCIITAKRIRDRSLFTPWGSVVTENPKGGGGSLKTLEGFREGTTQICLENRQDKTILYLEAYTVLCTSTFYPNNLKS